MNAGVNFSTGDILYFVHADSIPPPTYTEDDVIMEDFDLVDRIGKVSTFKIIHDEVIISARNIPITTI